jgi:hypothetical protein
MYKVSFFTFMIVSLACLPKVQAQSATDWANDGQMHYDDHIYRDNIKSVQLHQTTWKFSPPIIQLNSNQKLQLDFDDLDGDYKSYYYTFIHCDADWTPSDISPYDCVQGFSSDFLNNYSYSFNTYQRYTHYRLVFPDKSMKIVYSGNYILKIYKDNNPDSVIFTRRFMVYENLLTIHARERQAIGEDMYTKQEVIFSINTTQYRIADPFSALKVFILQNGRWDNAIIGLQPQYVQDTALQYFQDEGNIFDGGNQFRAFDMTSLKYNTEHIETMIKNPTNQELQLKKDVPRPAMPYSVDPDIDGQFMILTKDADSTPINADYVIVHFYVPMDTAFTTGDLYIFGSLSDWQCRKDCMMHYDATQKGYVGTLYLKQGYYDYQYAFLRNGAKAGDITVIEGNHMETENNYTIYAYYRELGLNYDKLLGVKTIHAPSN